MVLETGIFISQAIWLWRVRHVRREAKKAGKTYDEYIADNRSKDIPRSDSSETFVDVEACHESHCRAGATQLNSDEKRDSSDGPASTAAEDPSFTKALIARWKRLVLRPSS